MLSHLKIKTEIIKKKNKNQLISLQVLDDKLLGNSKLIQSKVENLKNIEVNDIPVFDNRYIKNKIKMYSDGFYTNF